MTATVDLFHFDRDIVSDPVWVPPLHGIHKAAGHDHRIMQMISARQPGGARIADGFTPGDPLVAFHGHPTQVSVHAEKAETMIHQHRIAVNPHVFGQGNPPGVGRRHGGMGRGGEIDSQVPPLVYKLIIIHVFSMVGKSRSSC
jgi:hypothetical protein